MVKVKLNYIRENRGYQRLLDQKYNGRIVPIDRFVNGKAIYSTIAFHAVMNFGKSRGISLI